MKEIIIDIESGLPIDHPLSYLTKSDKSGIEFRIAQGFKARLKDYLAGEDSKTKSAVRAFFGIDESRIMDCVKMITESISSYAKSLRERESVIVRFERERIELEEKISDLKKEVESLQKERDSLAERFSDPRARDAYLLYQEACKPDGKEDAYTKQRRVTAAGLMASAFLGLKEYNIQNKKNK